MSNQLTKTAMRRLIEQIEGHFMHPMNNTQEAVRNGASDQEILAAIELDRSHFSDIHNETDNMMSKFYSAIKYPKKPVSTKTWSTHSPTSALREEQVRIR